LLAELDRGFDFRSRVDFVRPRERIAVSNV
jgi:hypothetical protein